MTARLPARYGAHMSLLSMVQDSVSDWSQAWLFSKSPRLPVRSWRAPAAAYLETRVLPSSTTSGGLEPAKAASSLVVMLFHCWSSTLTVSLGWAFFQSALTASTTSRTAGGALPSISQMLRVRGPVWALDLPPSSEDPPQAATPRTRATARARTAERRWRRELDMDSSFCWDGRWLLGRGASGGCGVALQVVAAVDDGALGHGDPHTPGRGDAHHGG